MSALSLISIPMLWAQAPVSPLPPSLRTAMLWFQAFGEPTVTIPGFFAGPLIWLKVISLFCLLGWIGSWLAAALRERNIGKGSWVDIAALVAIVGVIATTLLGVLERSERIPIHKIGGVYTVTLLGASCAALLFLWVETAIWTAIRRQGRTSDLWILVGLHFGLALGIGLGFLLRYDYNSRIANTTNPVASWTEGITTGARFSATYMGYVVMARVLLQLLVEFFNLRGRRLYAIARLTVTEAVRRAQAPWVVIVLFGVVLAFTHWFLQPPRAAELGRLYVGTLLLLCSLLLTVMVTILTPLSLPQDIQNQTIYTVVSKPVRRLELVWGRMLGFMTLVTFLVVIFGVISLIYLRRTVGGAIDATQQAAIQATQKSQVTEANQFREQANQIRTRMSARVPVFGSLSFIDSRGTPHAKGIDVGQEQSMREPRSHIEGATPSSAIWRFGVIPDPMTPEGSRPFMMDRRIPVTSFLRPDTVEWLLDEAAGFQNSIDQAEQERAAPGLSASRSKELDSIVSGAKARLESAKAAFEKKKADADALDARIAAAEKAGNATEVASLQAESARLHSPPVPLEMTFNVYRTTKGKVGEPVFAELQATNPRTSAEYRNIFPIREYYTNRQTLPSSILAGSGGDLKIEIRCISNNQYLGMAESDLFLLSSSGDFGTNFMKGLFGVWLQAMVLTAIGVFAGTFLSWPVALLTTIAFFLAGQMAFTFLLDFTRQSLVGGGPFESLIRLLSHDNQMSDLTPTLPVVTAKTLDSLVMPLMSLLVYIVPNFSAMDVSNTVADGFAVSGSLMFSNFLLALAYALPFSIAGYFILKNREVAA